HKVSVSSLVAVLLALAVAYAPAADAGEPVVITGVTAWFKDYVFNQGMFELQKVLKQRSGGSMTIKWKGGPEVAPPFEQIQPLKDGVFDMLNTSGAYYTQIVPEAVLMDYLDGPVSELRKAGVIDLFDKVNQKKAGVKLLGLTSSGTPYHLFTKKPIKSIKDFNGKKMRGTPTYIPLIEGLGASPVIMPASEIYTALDRGVVDGFAWPRMGIEQQKLYEVTCCVINPGFWTVRTVLLMNLKAWEKLSPDQQKLLMESVIKIEEEMGKRHAAMSEKEIDGLVKKHNMKVIDLPEDQAKRYRGIAYTRPFKSWAKKMPKFTAKVEAMAKKVSPAWPPMSYHLIKISR
ncbi:MAG: TRAP transporter substrate-binding protein DctP, partial [Anaerolineae bacterium]